MTLSPAAVVGGLLVCSAPRPELAERLSIFAPLIGSWDLAVTDYDEMGRSWNSCAEWHFSWGLDGRGVLDVWICPRRDAREPPGAAAVARPEWGLSVRFFDPRLGRWRSTWVGPGRGQVRVFTASPTPDGLRLDQAGEAGTATSWTFSSLTPTSFRWRNEDHYPDGSTILQQTFIANRANTGLQGLGFFPSE